MQLDFRSSTSYSYPVFGKGEKMEIIPYRFGAGRFIFAENALSSLQEEIRRYGTNAFFLMGEKAFSLMEQFGLFEQETGLVLEKEIYEGFPTEEELTECKEKLTAFQKRAGGGAGADGPDRYRRRKNHGPCEGGSRGVCGALDSDSDFRSDLCSLQSALRAVFEGRKSGEGTAL